MDTIKDIAVKAQHYYECYQLWQVDSPRTPSPHNRTTVASPPIQARMPKSHLQLQEKDRIILMKLGACFLCCQQGHWAIECPVKERLRVRSRTSGREGKEPGRTEIKKEVVSRELPVDMESESE